MYPTVLINLTHWTHSCKVTTDIYDDAERQNLVLDDTVRLLFLVFHH